ncbi:divalent metal cation transporter [Pseudomonas aeruginosa]
MWLLVNAAILISPPRLSTVAAIPRWWRSRTPTLLDRLVGGAALATASSFGFALLAAGQSSTSPAPGRAGGDGGFPPGEIPCWQRRAVTRGLAPGAGLDRVLWLGEAAVGKLLVPRQVVLSLQLPFAL